MDLEIKTGFKHALNLAGYSNVWALVQWLKARPDGMYSALLQLSRIGELGAATIICCLVDLEAIKPKHLNSIPIEVMIKYREHLVPA